MDEFFRFLGASIIEFPLTGVVTRVIRLVFKSMKLPKIAVSLLTFVIASAGLTFLSMYPQGELSKFTIYQEINLGIWLLIDLLILDKRQDKSGAKVPNQ